MTANDMATGRQNKRQRRNPPGNDAISVASTGSFYGVARANQSNTDVCDDSYYWPPGVTLPVTSTPSRALPHRSTVYPANLQPTTLQSESESEEERPLKSTLDKILSSQTALQKQMEEVLCRVSSLEESIKESSVSSSSSCDEKKRKKRLSSELCGKVATIYQAMAMEDQFHLSERGDSVWNKKTKAKLREQITLADKENGFSSTEIDTAIKRYFESRKRMHRESKPEQRERVSAQEKQRKARSRRQRLFDRRKKCVRGSEQSWWEQLSLEYMSFESSDDEDVITVHSLPWRSKKLNDFLSVLDKRADDIRKKLKHHAAERKPRQPGVAAADSMPPDNSPKWAVSKEWKRDHVEDDAISEEVDLSTEGPQESQDHN